MDDDRAKDEIHCGCCVELRVEVKKLKSLLDGLREEARQAGIIIKQIQAKGE